MDGHLDRRVLAREIEDVGGETALAEQMLAARGIGQPGAGIVEPGVGAIEMEAPRPHRHPRPCGRMRLLRVAVEDEMVEPERIHQIGRASCRERVCQYV